MMTPNGSTESERTPNGQRTENVGAVQRLQNSFYFSHDRIRVRVIFSVIFRVIVRVIVRVRVRRFHLYISWRSFEV
jgi:hypothetical protein